MRSSKDSGWGETAAAAECIKERGAGILDDMTLAELEKALQVRIDIVKSSGQDFLDAILW